MTSNAGDGSAGSSSLVTQYEILRTAALGQALPPEARSGLMLFLGRGMWGWARATAMATASASHRPTCSSSLHRTISDNDSRAIIHIFAAMAMNDVNPGLGVAP